MNTEEKEIFEKDLGKLTRPELNETAKTEHGIENADEFPNAPSLIEAIIAKKFPKPEESKDGENNKSSENNTENQNQSNENKTSTDNTKKSAPKTEKAKTAKNKSAKTEKTVQINEMRRTMKGTAEVVDGKEIIILKGDFLRKHNPKRGDYLFIGDKGKISFMSQADYERPKK